jgi:hypothetical protein
MNRLPIFLVILAMMPAAKSQSYSPLYAPSTTINLVWSCVDANNHALPYAGLTLETIYWTNTNGHFHDSPSHPYSSISPTSGYADGNGNFPASLRTTTIGQAESIGATCYDYYGNAVSGEFNYAVGYTLYWTNNAVWMLVGGNTTNHGDNSFDHWMTTNGAYGIYYASQKYLTAHTDQGLLAANDMGLPSGGKFDLNDNWTSPHITHDMGTAADIRGNGGQYAIPNQYQAEFIGYCGDFQATEAIVENVGTSNQHVHCRWPF